MRVLLTGAAGFIGRHVLDALAPAEVHAVSRAPQAPRPGVTWHTADLLSAGAIRTLVSDVQPTHLVHLAWTTAHGTYWHNPANHDWVTASLGLLDAFAANGGRHAFLAGTCAEDDWTGTGRLPATRYGRCKAALRLLATDRAASHGLPLAWGRVFFTFGPGEAPARLVPSLSLKLLAGQAAETGPGDLERDFVCVEDLAAMVALASRTAFDGTIDLCSGQGTRIGDLAAAVARETGRADLLKVGALPARAGDPARLVGDARTLRSIGWAGGTDLEEAVRRSVAWWRENAA